MVVQHLVKTLEVCTSPSSLLQVVWPWPSSSFSMLSTWCCLDFLACLLPWISWFLHSFLVVSASCIASQGCGGMLLQRIPQRSDPAALMVKNCTLPVPLKKRVKCNKGPLHLRNEIRSGKKGIVSSCATTDNRKIGHLNTGSSIYLFHICYKLSHSL